MKLQNFRSYKDAVIIEFCDLTAFIGTNDVGKSSVLEALDIFFNEGKGAIKIDKDDVNKQAGQQGNAEICISICFEDLPENIIIDATNATTLQSEFMLNRSGQLEIVKKYANGGSPKIYIKASHPSHPDCTNLLLKKDAELREIIDQHGITCTDRVRKAVMRTTIWNHYIDELQLQDIELDVTKGDTKTIWDKLKNYLPLFTLFQADRKNSDGDSEVQDPLKEAVKEIINAPELREQLTQIANEVERKLIEVSQRTLTKLRELSPKVANSLNPVIPSIEALKWADVFKNVSISGDGDIPINKRGSGTKRLVLLSFFRAEAERRHIDTGGSGVIYAIEEPETSQHTENQKMLINAFLSLALSPNTQIIITTHSANIVRELNFSNLRLISTEGDAKIISVVSPGHLPYPSLNEVNFLAFSDVSEEYHNELYGFIEAEGLLNTYREGKPVSTYIKLQRNGSERTEQIIKTEYIRHQIHHPENTLNPRFTSPELRESITLMRDFIYSQLQ
jgi:hypothetical protein